MRVKVQRRPGAGSRRESGAGRDPGYLSRLRLSEYPGAAFHDDVGTGDGEGDGLGDGVGVGVGAAGVDDSLSDGSGEGGGDDDAGDEGTGTGGGPDAFGLADFEGVTCLGGPAEGFV
jgi:hypothetical protein